MADNYNNAQGLLNTLLTQILEQMGLGSVSAFLPLLGLGGRAGSNNIWATGGATPGQAAVSRLFDNLDAGYAYQRSAFSNAAQDRLLRAFYSAQGLSGEELDKAVADVNGIARMGLTMVDPLGAEAGLRGAQQLSRMAQRSYAGVNFEKSLQLASLNQYLYGTNEKDPGLLLDVISNARDYRGFSASQVMDIGKEVLMSDGVDKYMNNGTFDADKFRKKIKDMTAMIEPWKDVFGEDIPKLLKSFEALSDQSMNLNSMTVRSAGFRMSSVLDVTGANVQQLAAYKSQFGQVLSDPTGYTHSSLSALATAESMLLGTANNSTAELTTTEFQQNAALLYAGTAKGGFAASYAQAMAAYASKFVNRDGRSDAEYYAAVKKEFSLAYQNQLSAGYSGYDALAQLTGLSKSQLQDYAGTDIALSAEKEGLGAVANRQAIMQNVATDTVKWYSRNGNVNVSKYLSGLSSEKMQELLGKRQDEIAKELMASGISEDEARQQARKIQAIAADAMSVQTGGAISTIGGMTGAMASMLQEAQKEKLVTEMATVKDKVSSVFTIGGIREVVKNMKPETKIEDAIATALGAGPYGAAMMEGFDLDKFNGMSETEKNNELKKYHDRYNYLVQNTAAIADKNTAASWVYNTLNNKKASKEDKERALRIMDTTKDLDSGSQAALTQKMYKELEEENKGKPITTEMVADKIADERILGALGGKEKADKGIQAFLKNSSITSKSKLEEALKNDKTLSEDQKSTLRAAVNKSDAFPTIDGQTPVQQIMNFCSEIERVIKAIATKMKAE